MSSIATSIQSVVGASITLFAFIIVLELLIPWKIEARFRTQIRAVACIIMGVAALAFHIRMEQGVILDVRGAVLVVATFFGGYWVGAATAVAEAVTRGMLGGPVVVAGLASIVSSYLLCCLILRFGKRAGQRRIGFHLILLAGLAVGTAEALCLLLVQPFSTGLDLFTTLGGDLVLIQFVSTMLFAGLLKLQADRAEAMGDAIKNNLSLRDILKQTVSALSSAMIHRDLTTAGHEKTVADLAVALGRELGLDAHRLEGLHLAALVHDVGQIQIPVEILTRPRRLIPQEFDLLKEHSKAGYEILKTVPFVWPVAEIVLQHHENFDGSGYPRGLKTDEILLEARIIRVCDSLEAMMSHRPYRRAYSLGYALEQLNKFSGSYFDPAVTAACIRVLGEKGYPLLTTGKLAAA